MSGSLADCLADTAFQLAAELDCEDTPRPVKRARLTAPINGTECTASESLSNECDAKGSSTGETSGHDIERAEELTGTTTRRSLHERVPPESSSFEDWITMVIKVPTAIAPGAVCKIFSPDGRAHFVTVPTSLPPGGSFIKALPKAYTEDILKTLDRSEMKQWLRHRLEMAGQDERQKYSTQSPTRQELLRTCVQWLRDTKAKVLQEAAAHADGTTGNEEPPDVTWRAAWSGTYERLYWWHPVTRDTAWERPTAATATSSKQPRKSTAQDEHAVLPLPPDTSELSMQLTPCPMQGDRKPDTGTGPSDNIQAPAPRTPVPVPAGQ